MNALRAYHSDPKLKRASFARRGKKNGSFRHGLHGTSEYRLWAAMVQRCTNPNRDDYAIYGGRGITVCSKWRASFPAFLADMGLRPSPEHTLERVKNDAGYEPGNVVWATRIEQARNTSRSRVIEMRGERKTLAEWSRVLAMPRTTLRDRLDRHGDGHLIDLLAAAPVKKGRAA